MKKTIIFLLIATMGSYTQAQILDTVSLTNSFVLQKWYSLEHGEQSHVNKLDWDLAFELSGFGVGIRVNHASLGAKSLWVYPNGDTSSWNNIDTTGIALWDATYNYDADWSQGAFNTTANPSNSFDVGWGVYNLTTHVTTGDSLYIIKLSDQSYRKLWIQNLAGGSFNFKYAHLDGTLESIVNFAKNNFSEKNFGYYSLLNQQSLDPEPNQNEWDLLFSQYLTRYYNNSNNQLVSGVLANKNIEVAKVSSLENPETYAEWDIHTFTDSINSIGYSWKSLNYQTFQWDIQDSTLYFVKDINQNIWKLQFVHFDGSSAGGNYVFSKEKLSEENENPNSLSEVGNTIQNKLTIYPNPIQNGNTNLLLETTNPSSGNLSIYNITGKNVYNRNLDLRAGFHQIAIQVNDLYSGMYIVVVNIDHKTYSNKLIIK